MKTGERKTVVLEMVKAVRDRLAALILDNTNIRAACDDLRRQCHSQGVAFGDLSRLVKQSQEDQEETRAYAHEETRPHPRIRPELIDVSTGVISELRISGSRGRMGILFFMVSG